MKALIFAAGLGTRLHPLTNKQPKALVQVAGKPMLQHLIIKLKAIGITKIIINIHHFGEQIIEFLEKNKNFGCTITISDEREKLLDTGGGLKKALFTLNDNEDLLVHNVDVWTNFDLNLLIKHHRKSQSQISLLIQNRETSRYLLFHPKNKTLEGWINKKTQETIPVNFATENYDAYAFNGIHIINSNLKGFFPKQDTFGIIPVYLEMAKNHKISGLEMQGDYWLDLGKKEQIKQAENLKNNHNL